MRSLLPRRLFLHGGTLSTFHLLGACLKRASSESYEAKDPADCRALTKGQQTGRKTLCS